MPTYDFRCNDCDYEFAIIQMMNDERPTVCPQCEGELRRVIGLPMIAPDLAPYQSIITGEIVNGRVRHREHLARNHLVEVGDQMSSRQKDYLETDFEQRLAWHRGRGEKPPENLRQIVDGETDG